MAIVGSGVIGPKEADELYIPLQGGVAYSIYVEPDNPDVDFDLFVYDERGHLVTQDVAPSSEAHCSVIPKQSGLFRLVIKSAKGLGTYYVRVHEES